MKRIQLLLASIGVAATAGYGVSAFAGEVSISNIVGTWTLGTPVANVTYFNSGTNNPLARWGGDQNTGSGYDFRAATPPAITVTLPPSPSAFFTLGDFTHVNRPIPAGTSITSIALQLTADISVDGNPLGQKSFLYDFLHNETTNNADPCADGGVVGVGVNINGCADNVVIVNNVAASDTFLVGTEEYTLFVTGFQFNGVPMSDFWTIENNINTASLRARWSLAGGGVPPGELPEPATLAILGLGLLGLVAGRRRFN